MRSDSGLMGPTHALSAVAISFLFTWIASEFMFEKLLGSNNYIVFIAAVIIIVGSSLMPDLDASQSTSINTLGPIGSGLSKMMRSTSSIIQSSIRSKNDSAHPDPHRGFWHTILSGIMIGLITMSLTSVDVIVFSFKDTEVTIAMVIVIFIIYISIQLLMASLFKKFYKKTKGSIKGKLAMKSSSLIVSIALLILLPSELNYNWVGVAVAFGWIVHILGDAMTVSGVPLLFPFKYKGKRWWSFRLPLGIKAGGWIEMSILVPLFTIIAIISAIGVIPLLN